MLDWLVLVLVVKCVVYKDISFLKLTFHISTFDFSFEKSQCRTKLLHVVRRDVLCVCVCVRVC